MMFTERDAIQQELQELKEQARRDYDLYLESRIYRNTRTTELLDRLRVLDSKEEMRECPKPVDTILPIIRQFGTTTGRLTTGHPSIPNVPRSEETADGEQTVFAELQSMPTKSIVQENIEKEIVTHRKQKPDRIPTERVAPVVIDYLIKNDGVPKRLKDIQKYTEAHMDTKWVNFNTVFLRILSTTDRIKKVGKGTYIYDKHPID